MEEKVMKGIQCIGLLAGLCLGLLAGFAMNNPLLGLCTGMALGGCYDIWKKSRK
jgi:uncharacterized membrane protein